MRGPCSYAKKLETDWLKMEEASLREKIMCCASLADRRRLEAVGISPNHCYSVRHCISVPFDRNGKVIVQGVADVDYLRDEKSKAAKVIRLLQLRNPQQSSVQYAGAFSNLAQWPPEMQIYIRQLMQQQNEKHHKAALMDANQSKRTDTSHQEKNPWGPQDPNMFWIRFEDFLKYFGEITISSYCYGWNAKRFSNLRIMHEEYDEEGGGPVEASPEVKAGWAQMTNPVTGEQRASTVDNSTNRAIAAANRAKEAASSSPTKSSAAAAVAKAENMAKAQDSYQQAIKDAALKPSAKPSFRSSEREKKERNSSSSTSSTSSFKPTSRTGDGPKQVTSALLAGLMAKAGGGSSRQCRGDRRMF
jgi:hypothetical protein